MFEKIKTKKQLEWNLLAAEYKKGTPHDVIERIRQEGLDYLAKRKSDNARRKQLDRMWYEHLTPLLEERKRVVASLAYTGHNRNNADPRQMALKAYKKVLDELLRRMKREAIGVPFDDRPALTPMEYAKVKNVPNGGEHWTDFVPAHIKQRVVAMFDAVPHTPKARRKIPFERIVGIELHNLRKERLTRRTEKELVKCKQDLLLSPHKDGLRERIERMETALEMIDALDQHEPVPMTWQGLY